MGRFDQFLDDQLAITPAEFRLFIGACAGATSNRRVNQKWTPYFQVLWQTGIRASEGLNIRAEDVERQHIRVFRLKRRKTGRSNEDWIPIQAGLWIDLNVYMTANRIRADQRLWPHTIQQVEYIWGKARAKAGIRQELTPHSLRHGLSHNYVAQSKHSASETLVRLQRLLGHASPYTTARYLRISMKDVDEDIQLMDF